VGVPEIDYRGKEPPHRQVAAWLRQQIAAGEYAGGRALPSEKDLQDMFGLSRDTIRRVFRLLRDEGLIMTIPQRGSYVREEGED
jgi:DNA-binding GntR family transcriptional regulator